MVQDRARIRRRRRSRQGKDDEPEDISPSIHFTKKHMDYDDDDDMGGKSPSSASTLSTDLPSDDDYLTEWEEWTAVENGFGPCDSNTVQVKWWTA